MKTTLARIAKELNAVQAVWAIGGSVMLAHHGLVDCANDIDILVEPSRIVQVDIALQSLGVKKKWEKDKVYATKHFFEYCIDGTDVDIISGFRINTASGLYQFQFDERSIADTIRLKGQPIHMASLEDWYVLYQLMPDREEKVVLIESYLMKNGVKNRFLLERALQGNVPEPIRKRSRALLG